MLLSRNYPPSDALSPYIRRHYVFEAALPADFMLADQLLSENAFVRILVNGDWQAETAPGYWTGAGPVVLFGANARPFRVRVKGPFTVAGFAIRPGGWRSLFARPAADYTDQMLPLEAAWGAIAGKLWDRIAAADNDDAMVAAMEQAVSAQLDHIGLWQHDPRMARFEHVARMDSTKRVEEAAAELGLSVRQLERRCLATFGLSPKAVLRRSRFLDMAAAMRGFSTPSEEELAELRYFDQSHLTREFRRFTGLTPMKFRQASTPLLTAGLKLRAEGNDFNWDGSDPPRHESVLPPT